MENCGTELSELIARSEEFWKGFETRRAEREARRRAWAELEASGLPYVSPEHWAEAKRAAAEKAEKEAEEAEARREAAERAAERAAEHRNPRPKRERTRYSLYLGGRTYNQVAFKPGMLDWLYGWMARDGVLYLRVWETPKDWEKTRAEIETAQDYKMPQTYEGFMEEPQAKGDGVISRKSEESWGSYEVNIKVCPEAGVDMPGLLVALGMEEFGPNYGQDDTDVIRMKGHRKDLFYQLMDAGFRYWDQPQDVGRIRGRVPPEYLQDFDEGLAGRLPDKFRELLG
jgi:hypothetical protein